MVNLKHWREIGGKRLHAARKAARNGRGYTFQEMSDALRVYSVSRLHGYEAGYRGMTPDVADDIGRFLGVSAAYLLCVDTDEHGIKTDDDEARLLLQRWKYASPEVRAIVRDILARHAE